MTTNKDLWIDPDAGVSDGVLLSDRICAYVQHVGLIAPFDPRRLGPASYDLTLGLDCWYAQHLKDTGEAMRRLSEAEPLILPPNSITFVTTQETLRMPFYLAARFNLKLRFLHEGLLLGTGPQVDPGFRGRFSCPIHNISNEKIALKAGESFLVVEFHKTTPFAQMETLDGFADERELRAKGEARQLKGFRGFECLTFPTRSLDREPVKRYVPAGRLVTSSVQGIAESQQKLKLSTEKKTKAFERKLQTVNIIAFVTVVTVAVTLSAYFYSIATWYKGFYEEGLKQKERISALEAGLAQSNEQLRALQTAGTNSNSAIRPESKPGRKWNKE